MLKIFFFAFTIVSAVYAQNSVYIGVQGGRTFGTQQIDARYTDFLQHAVIISDNKVHSIKSPFIGLNLGLLKKCGNWGWGIEGIYNHVNYQNCLSQQYNDYVIGRGININLQNNFSNQLGIMGKVGYTFFNQYFTYGMLGLSKQKIDSIFTGVQSDLGAGVTPETYHLKKTKWVSGYLFGVGVEKNINPSFKAGVEATWQNLKQSSFNLDYEFAGTGSTEKLRTNYKKNNMFFIGLRFTYSLVNF